MKIGMLINSDQHLDAMIGLTRKAVERGHEVLLFAMDSGTRLLADPGCQALASLPGVHMSYCDHSARDLQVNTGDLPEAIECSSQFSNASMNHNADKVLVL